MLLDHFAFIEADRDIAQTLKGEYSYLLVFVSVLVAVLASYTAFLLVERINSSEKRNHKISWYVTGAAALGGGIWAMHFIGMLAFKLPMYVSYDVLLTGVSVLPGLLASLVVLYCNSRRDTSTVRIIWCSVLMGSGIGLMHYTGMAAMHTDAVMRYKPVPFALSIIVGIVLSYLSLRVKHWADDGLKLLSENKALIFASITMGCAISAMHYTGMAAVEYFMPEVIHEYTHKQWEWAPDKFAVVIALVVSGMLILLLVSVVISKRLALMARLQASEARLLTLFNTVVDGVISINNKGIIESFNQAAEKIFGYEANEVVGRNVSLLMTGKDAEHHDEYLDVSSGKYRSRIIGVERELLGRRKNGSTFPIEIAINAARIENQHIYIGTVRDISARKMAEDALFCARRDTEIALHDLGEKERVLRLALSAAGAGYFSYAPGQETFSCDEQALRIHGIQEMDAEVMRPWELFVHPDEVKKVAEHYRIILENPERTTFELEYRIQSPDAEIHFLEVVGFIERDEKGQATDVHGLYFDHTQRKQDEVTLQRAKEAAEDSSKAKSQFLANMSHEIRTPLNGVLGMLHLLKNTELADKQKRFVNTAASSSEMLLTVINDILDFSKIDAGKMKLESIPFEPLRLIEDTVALMANGAHEKGLELISSASASLSAMVKGDPTRLRQILTNLVSNAIKFTSEGQVVLYATMVEDRVLFGVVDTGMGMSSEQQKIISQPFTQADSSHTRKYGGTGLGLVICKSLVEAMGGELRIISCPGLGSDFNFDLPLEILDSGLSRAEGFGLLAKQRMLIVDDNATNRDVLKNILQSWQVVEIVMANDASDALKKIHAAQASAQSFDVALLDMQMPGMTGLELAQVMRNDDGMKDIRLIMLSSLDRNDDIDALDAWITKPVRQSELYNTLVMVLNGQTVLPADVAQQQAKDWQFKAQPVLLVDDNETNQEVAREILTSAGLLVDIQENGAKALQAVQHNDYALVLMDIQMPVMDGLEATKKIRELDGVYKDLPIIAMTAHALAGDNEKSLAAGMNAHVTKPINPDELFATLSRWLTRVEKIKENTLPGSDEMPEVIPELPGFDIAAGLARLRNKWSSYKKLLIAFANKQNNAVKKISRLVTEKNWQEAANIAHGIKGSSGNLAAMRLYESAAEVENLCRDENEDSIGAALMTLQINLTEAIESISTLTEKSSANTGMAKADVVDIKQLNQLLDEIESHLQTDLGEAQRCLENLETLCSEDFMDLYSALETSFNSFDMDAINQSLHTFKHQISGMNRKVMP